MINIKFLKKSMAAFICISLPLVLYSTVYALTDAEAQSAVTSQGKEAVSGNVFIWFLCAVAFLKISQKIDSFMSGLGVNVGHTGGSLMAEALIAGRSLGAGGKAIFGKGFGGGGSSSGTGTGDKAGFLSGGLAGVVGRNINNSAVNAATDNGGGLFGKKAFETSLKNGGDFAKDVIGKVANGDISKTGSITGETADKALSAYLGFDDTAPEIISPGEEAAAIPTETGGIDASADNFTPDETADSPGVGTQPEASAASDVNVESASTADSIPMESTPKADNQPETHQETGAAFDGGEQAAMTPDNTPIGEPPPLPDISESGLPELPEIVPDGDSADDNAHPVTVLPDGQNGGPTAISASETDTTSTGSVASIPAATSISGSSNQTQSNTVVNSSNSTVSTVSATAEVSATTAVTQQEHVNNSVSVQGDSLVSVSASSDIGGLDNQTPYISSGDNLIQSAASIPIFSNVEIGGGRITGTETSENFPNGIEFGMYSTAQYMKPEGEFTTVKTVDGAKWYKQYAAAKVEKTPLVEESGKIKYEEKIVNKMPSVPRRKDRV